MKKLIRQTARAKFKLLILAFAFIGVIMVAGNISLAVNRDALDQGFAETFEHDMSVGPVFYIFPNRIILKDITIKKDDSLPSRSSLVFPEVAVRFFFWDFLFDRGLRVSDVTLFPSTINYYAASQFLEDNYQKILEIIRNSSGEDIKVRVKETLLDFDRKGNPDYVAMELSLAVKGDSIEGAGYFRTDQYSDPNSGNDKDQHVVKGWPLWYKWKGQLKSDGIAFDHFILKSENMYSKLWGSVRSGLMKVNGFLFMDTTIQNSSKNEFSLSRHFKNFSTDDEMPNIDIYVLDIDGQMNFSFPEIKIDRFNFALNNIPVTMKGDISILDTPTLNADLIFRHSLSHVDQNQFFEKADVHLTSTWKDQVLRSNGTMDIQFMKHGDLSFAPEDAQLIFSDLQFRFDRSKRPVINLALSDLTYWTDTNEHRILIRDLKAVTDTQREGLKIVEFSAPFYDGSLTGKMRFDSTQTPTRVTSHIELNNVDTDTLEELMIHFAKFNGTMSSSMEFTNVPYLNLSGEVTIADGQMTDFNFFNWVADSFRLPVLKAIDFKRASARFMINKNDIQLRDIRLTSEDVGIEGYFDIDHQNLVESEITLSLSKDLLGVSPKFKPVLKIFNEDDSHLNFDFRLSGNVDAMNFQWMPSPVKTKIQTRIPDFIERKIERNIDSLREPETVK